MVVGDVILQVHTGRLEIPDRQINGPTSWRPGSMIVP
jgi:hypothetical protein